MKFYTEEETLDMVLGEKGTEARDEYEAKVDEFLIGEAIRQARLNQNLSQEQLGNLVGVKKAQISKIENGGNVTLRTIVKVFKAMGLSANLQLDTVGSFALC